MRSLSVPGLHGNLWGLRQKHLNSLRGREGERGLSVFCTAIDGFGSTAERKRENNGEGV